MRVIPPLPITDARLTYTSVPEVPPLAYNAGTTYAADALSSTGTAGGVISVWRSLLDNNTNHDPASSPTWWTLAGETYVEYSGATFAKYDRVIDATAHMVYESLVDPNTGNALSDTTKWGPVGLTNQRAMFDLARNTRTVAPGAITVRVTPGMRCNALSVAGVAADTVTANVSSGGTEVFTLVKTLGTRDVYNYTTFCFEPFSRRDALVTWDLPPYTDAVIEVTLSASEGNVECGTFAIGRYIHFGEIEYGASASGINYSQVNRDQWSYAELIPERNVPATEQTVWVKKSRVAALRRALSTELNGVVAVWAGLDDDAHGYFDPLFIVGFSPHWVFDLDHPDDALLRIQMEEI